MSPQFCLLMILFVNSAFAQGCLKVDKPVTKILSGSVFRLKPHLEGTLKVFKNDLSLVGDACKRANKPWYCKTTITVTYQKDAGLDSSNRKISWTGFPEGKGEVTLIIAYDDVKGENEEYWNLSNQGQPCDDNISADDTTQVAFIEINLNTPGT